METTAERKKRYIKTITEAHPVWGPETAIAGEAAKRLQKLPEQTVFYLFHLIPAEHQIKPRKEA